MDQESIVYGCIKDTIYTDEPAQLDKHRAVNREVMYELPSMDDWPLLGREMFSMPAQATDLDDVQTDVMHFGSSYKAVEYEWEQWLTKFEGMLQRMYWVSATVHLETELNGSHTFTWEAEDELHVPNEGGFSVRCEWSRDSRSF